MSTALAKYNPVDTFGQQLEVSKHVGKMIVQSGKWAKDWNEATTGIIVMYAMDLGIHPVTACIDGFDVIQGKIQMKPKMMSALIRKSGHSIQFVQNDNKACVLKGRRKDNGDECTVSFTIEDAKQAKLASKENYSSWSADMLYSRAMGRLGRMLFADVIGGCYTDGEIEDIQHKSRKSEELKADELQVVQNESETINSEVTPIEPGINDLLDNLASIGLEASVEDMEGFVRLMSIKHNASELSIIKSALSTSDQLEKFKGHFLKAKENA